MGWDRYQLQDLLRRIDEAGPMGPAGPETAVEALEARLAWLARAWPGTTRAERLGPALDDLPQYQRDQLAAAILGGLNDPEDHDHDEEN